MLNFYICLYNGCNSKLKPCNLTIVSNVRPVLDPGNKKQKQCFLFYCCSEGGRQPRQYTALSNIVLSYKQHFQNYLYKTKQKCLGTVQKYSQILKLTNKHINKLPHKQTC